MHRKRESRNLNYIPRYFYLSSSAEASGEFKKVAEVSTTLGL